MTKQFRPTPWLLALLFFASNAFADGIVGRKPSGVTSTYAYSTNGWTVGSWQTTPLAACQEFVSTLVTKGQNECGEGTVSNIVEECRAEAATSYATYEGGAIRVLTRGYYKPLILSPPAHCGDMTYLDRYQYRGITVKGDYGPDACPPNSTSATVTNLCTCDKNFSPGPDQQSCVPTVVTNNTQKSGGMCGSEKKSSIPSFGNPIFPLTGSKKETLNLGLELSGQSFSLIYDSTPKVPLPQALVDQKYGEPDSLQSTAFGELWLSNFNKKLGFDLSRKIVRATRGNGEVVNFTSLDSIVFLPQLDTKDQLTAVGEGYLYLDAENLTQEIFNPDGQLVRATRASGESWTYQYSDASTPASTAPGVGYLLSIQDNFGRSLNLKYALDGKVSSITDPAGQLVQFTYTGNNLTKLTWPNAKFKQFLYENPTFPWALTGVIDERGKRYATFGYDTAGRAVSTEHTGGVDRYSVTYASPPLIMLKDVYDPESQTNRRTLTWQAPITPVVTTPTGAPITLGVLNVLGYPKSSSRSQAAGAGCDASVSNLTYDARGNIASLDDFNGFRTCYFRTGNDLLRNLETSRVEGLAKTTDCSALAAESAALPVGSRRISSQWHPTLAIRTKLSEPGRVTTLVYNGQPDPFSGNAVASCAPTEAVLADKTPIAVLCKQVEQATLDANGSKGFGAPAKPADTNFGSDSLLLHMEGTNGAAVFTDSSPLAQLPSSVKLALTDTANAKFGLSSGKFSGGYFSYAASPSLDMGSANFTIETWAKFNADSPNQRAFVLGQADANGGNWSFYVNKGIGNWIGAGIFTNAGAFNLASSTAVVPNTWYHLALVRSGTQLSLWINGTLAASAAVSGTIPARTSHVSIGAFGDYAPGQGGTYGTESGTAMMGWLDDVRITKGIARYAQAFTPVNAPFGDSVAGTSAVASAPVDSTVLARTTTWTYNRYGQVLTRKGPRTDLDDTVKYDYYTDTTSDHTLGDLKQVSRSAVEVTQFTKYNRFGQVLESKDANGVLTVNWYDPMRRLQTVTTAGLKTTYDYDDAGQLKKVTSPDASWIGFDYDDAHRQSAVYDHLGNRIEYTLDSLGNRKVENVKDNGSVLRRQLTRNIDALGRVQQTVGQ